MKKIIIIGAGITGLSAGVYAQRSGFDTTIFEMHTIPGGNSTSWKRKGYLFEGGMHWLTGSSKQSPLHRLWTETGAINEDTPIYNRDPFITYLNGEQEINLYRDTQKLEQHLLSISPKDKKAIRSLCKDIQKFSKVQMPIIDVKGVQVKYKATPPLSMLFSMLPALPRMNALMKCSCADYINRFKHAGIRALLKNIVFADNFSATAPLFTLGCLSAGDGGYPKGGSLKMAQNMADHFEESGGHIQYKSQVERLLIEHNKVVGLIINGEKISADHIIVTADTLSAIDHLSESPLQEAWMEDMRRDTLPMLNTFLSLGVEADLSSLPENFLFSLKEAFTLGDQKITEIGINNYANFKGYAPAGCTALTSAIMGDTYDFWKQAKQDGTYESKKKELAETIMNLLSDAFPQMEGNFSVWDVATPLTYERYCGTYKGSWMSITPPGSPMKAYPCKSETIDGLYFAGQRIQAPGGLPIAVSTGRSAIQYLCKDLNIVFECSV